MTGTLLRSGLLLIGLLAWASPARAQSTADPWWTHAALTGYAVGQMTDISTSMYLFGAQRGSEANPLLRPFQDRPVAMGVAKGSIATAIAVMLLKNHEAHPKKVFWVSLALAAAQGWVTYHNSQALSRR